MLLENYYTIVPQIKFKLTYDNNVRKSVTVKTNDNISCSYKKNGEIFFITGNVTKIGCNFNSSLGSVGTTAYIEIDGSTTGSGEIIYVQPSQVLDITINTTTDTIENVVCSVDNEDQRITLIRENEVGVFQYTTDGITWKATTGAQGKSAYECAVALGYTGTEAEWLASLKGEKGDTGEAGALEIYKVFKSAQEALEDRATVPTGKLVGVLKNSDTLLYVRVEETTCTCTNCTCANDSTTIKGYKYLGSLTLGPQGKSAYELAVDHGYVGTEEEWIASLKGEKGDKGKSAYEQAVEGGYTGTEEEFIKSLARSSIAVTNYIMAENPALDNTVIGPINLKIFGFTSQDANLTSRVILRVDIYSKDSTNNQTLLFPEPITLRAIPTDAAGVKPNLVIDGQNYVSDMIGSNDKGEVGILRRIKYIDSYNGETIIGDWMSSTGELDLGAHVQYVYEGEFTPFSAELQSQYNKLHTYDEYTQISVTYPTTISIVYPVDIKSYITTLVDTKVTKYIEENAERLITPIVKKQVGDLPEGKTVTEYVDDKIGDLPEGETNVVNYVSSSTTLADPIITTVTVGGIPAGTVIDTNDKVIAIVKELVAPSSPTMDIKIYLGTSATVPPAITSLASLDANKLNVLANGIHNVYSANNEHLCLAYPKDMGKLASIQDKNGLELIAGWSSAEGTSSEGVAQYIYYSNEALSISNFNINFFFNA